jgi:carbon monoxide dehydrogenase subunit G
MKQYTSKQVQINKPSALLYSVLSNFDNFKNMIPKDQVEDFESNGDTCSFTAPKIGKVELQIVDREENKMIKITSPNNKPFEFFFWVQFVELAPGDTRMRLTLKIKLNMMLKMLLKGKLQSGIDQMAEQIAMGFNQQ